MKEIEFYVTDPMGLICGQQPPWPNWAHVIKAL